MEKKTLNGKLRSKGAKSLLSKIRNNHDIPGVCYGNENFLFQIKKNDFHSAFKDLKYHIPFSFLLDNGKKVDCLIKHYEQDPITKEIIHVDFLGIGEDNIIKVEIPILTHGLPIGTKQGGILEQKLYTLKVSTFVKNIPKSIDLDVSNLEVRNSIYVRDLKFDTYTKILNSSSQLIVTLSPSRITRLAEAKEQEKAKAAKKPQKAAVAPKAEAKPKKNA